MSHRLFTFHRVTTAIYVRLSRDPGQTELAVRRQRADCEQLCKAKQWAPTRVYEDNDVSAYSGKKRPAYEQLLADIKNGDIDRVVAWHPDRLHRNNRELEDFIDILDAAQCPVHTVTAGPYDLATPEGRLVARIVGSVARKESEDKSRRIARKHLELAEAGRGHVGGTRPFGYNLERGPDGHVRFVVNEPEATVVRDLMDRFLAGESGTSLIRDLVARGVPTASGGQWRHVTLRTILTSATIAGQRTHRGQIVAVGDWPAIVTPEQVRAAAAIYLANSSAGTRRRESSPLAGLLVCGLCGARMYAGEIVKGVRKFRCQRPPVGCGRVTITRQILEDIVVEAVIQAAESPKLARIVKNGQRTRIKAAKDAEEAEAQLAELAAAYADKIISMAEWKVARDRIQQRIDAAAGITAAASPAANIRTIIGDAPLRDKWPSLNPGQRRAVCATFINTITVAPWTRNGRPRFDIDRVDIDWRG